MEKESVCVTIRKDIKKRAKDALDQGKFVGTTDLSNLIDVALDSTLKTVGA